MTYDPHTDHDPFEVIEQAQDEYDVCAVCGDEYVDVDMTLSGEVVFIHSVDPVDDTCDINPDDLDIDAVSDTSDEQDSEEA